MWETTVASDRLRFNEAVVPEPFSKPSSELDTFQLFEQREFSSALQKSYEALSEVEEVPSSSSALGHVLQLWLVRLKCLLCLKLGVQAAEEAAACLADLNSDEAAEKQNELPVIWDLKLLLVPATARGINVTAIQLYYTLGAEAKRMNDPTRLRLAGKHVTATLLSLRDYITALNHLKSTYESEVDGEDTAFIISLVYLELGDTLTAREWIAKASKVNQDTLLELCAFADDEPDSNGGVAKLYRGHTKEAVESLETEAVTTPVPTIANLLVLYDLQHSDWRSCREHLAQFLVEHGRTHLGNYAMFID